MNILVVEDDGAMARTLAKGLREEGHEVDVAADGRAALRLSSDTAFDIIVLDVMLPHMDGMEVAKQLRLQSNPVPILMLTARDTLPDIVTGLDAGADDYLTKPFSFVELLARLRALERRTSLVPRNVLELGDLVLDVTSYRAFRAGHEIFLSTTEFRLLELLMRHPGRVLSRRAIMDAVWGCRRDIEANTVDAFVRLLRKKLEQGSGSKLIQTHRGFGYSAGAETLPAA
jgi:DNA-binding response OmpR family regulator